MFSDLSALRADLVAHRRVLRDAAAQLGMGVAAAGAVPLSVPAEMEVTETPRYRRMLADYQLLAREQLICGTQVHVEITDRDEAVAVANRVAPYLPIFLALSASSPFWSDGSDTGYASVRTAGLAALADHGRRPVRRIRRRIRRDRSPTSSPAASSPTRAWSTSTSGRPRSCRRWSCGSATLSPGVDTIVLIAGLYRALVHRELARVRAGEPGLPSRRR